MRRLRLSCCKIGREVEEEASKRATKEVATLE